MGEKKHIKYDRNCLQLSEKEVDSRMEKETGKGHTFFMMVKSMLGNLKMGKGMVRGYSLPLMERSMSEDIKKVKGMARVYSLRLTGSCMMENGRMV